MQEDREVAQMIIDTLRDLSTSKKLVIVEGKKDVRALKSFGIVNIRALEGEPLFSVAEKVAATEKEIALLVDLDGEGKKLYSKLSKDLMRLGVKVDDKLRKLLFKTPVRQIEGLATWIAMWEDAK